MRINTMQEKMFDRLDESVLPCTVMRLGEVIRRWRKMSDAGIREVAQEIGVSHGTLSRIERGEPMQGETLAKVLAWLFADEAKNGGRAKERK